MLLKIHPKPYKAGSESVLQNMLVSKFPAMVLFTQTLVRLDDSEVSLGKDDFDEVLVRFYPGGASPVQLQEAEKHEDTGVERREISVPLRPNTQNLKEVAISLHGSDTTGYSMGEKFNLWFSECFGFPVMLVYLGSNLRPVLGSVGVPATSVQSPSSWFDGLVKSVSGIGGWNKDQDATTPSRITFADCAAYLVVTEESLADVSSRLEEEGPMDITKFRPNIVLSGAPEAWEEDFWGALKIFTRHELEDSDKPTAQLILTANCGRCVSINIDYATGRPGEGESGSILKKLMKDRRVDTGYPWNPIFGRYGFLSGIDNKAQYLRITVGDAVEVAKRLQERDTFGK
jgi:uncharacterized protein YcbX